MALISAFALVTTCRFLEPLCGPAVNFCFWHVFLFWLIIRDGLIQDVGEKVKIPKDATILDLTGKTIYPGFIESWFQQNLLDNNENHNKHWNFKVNARRDISKLFKPNKKDIQSLRDLGFTAAHIVPDSGVFQGSTSLIQLNDKLKKMK